MPSPTGISGPITVHVSSRSTLVDSMQEITLRAALDNAIGLTADCFDNCNRIADPASLFSQQSNDCEEHYPEVGSHGTTLYHTEHFMKSLVHSGLDYLKAATDAALNTGSDFHSPSLALTRSLIEASAECVWLADPALTLDVRLRRTSQLLVRGLDEILRVLPDEQETTTRLFSVDPVAKANCLEARDAALEWAKAQGWACSNGKAITRSRWIKEIPNHTEAVALAAKGAPAYWKDVYRTLSGATHSQPLLTILSLFDEPRSLLDRALVALDIGVSFYTDALRQFAELMGWHDHDLEEWFAPLHLAIQHIRTPEDVPLPRIELEQCEVCPEYQEPHMHRLALASHLCALMENHVNGGSIVGESAPIRYAAVIDFFDNLYKNLASEPDVDSDSQEMLTAVGTGHAEALKLDGVELREAFKSVAASWAILRSQRYQASIGRIQRWWLVSGNQSSTSP